MENIIIYLMIGAVSLGIGLLLGKILFAKNTKQQIDAADFESKRMLADAKLNADSYKKERELEAKEKFVTLKSAHESEPQRFRKRWLLK